MADQGSGSVSEWIDGLRRSGNEAAASQLWTHFLYQLAEHVSQRIRSSPLRIHDTDDVVLATFDSVLRAIRENRYRNIQHREELWWLLLAVADRKAIDVERFESRQKRCEGRPPPALFSPTDGSLNLALEKLPSAEPTPEFAALVEDESRRLMALLNRRQQEAASLRLEGYTHREIARRLSCSIPTVERYLHITRRVWTAELAND